MTRDERIRYMRGYLDAERAMRELQEEIILIRTRAEHITTSLDGMPHGSGVNDKVGNAAVAIEELERELNNLKGSYLIQLAKVQCAVMQLEAESKERELMRLRYLEGMKWEDIAHAMNYDSCYLIRLHGQTIDNMIMS